MNKNVDYTLYLCTDRNLMTSETIELSVKEAIEGGCTVIQLREKDTTSLEFYNIAKSIKKITDNYSVPLIINDRLDIAIAVDAAGVHLGQKDLPAQIVRKIVGENKIIGVSTATVEEAIKAEEDGANYIGVGAVFSTGTKLNTRKVTFETLSEISKSVNIPLVAIGGINLNNIDLLQGSGISGVAVVSAVIAQKDVKNSAAELYKKVINIKNNI